MLADIGVMVAAYIFTRMVSFLARTGDRSEHVIVKILAVVTAIVAVLCAMDMLTKGTATPTIP